MKKTWILANLAALAICSAGCDPKEGSNAQGDDGGQSSSTGEEGETEDPDPVDDDDIEESSTGELPDEESGDTEEECSFIDCTTGGPDVTGGECSLWDQDCPGDEKCNPYANDGGASWNSSRCAPLDSGPGQPGDPCNVEGSGVSGVDSCDVGSMCWNVDEENTGTCVSLCQGTEANPLCDNPTDQCIIANDGWLPLCLPQCDPLLGCQDGEGCYPADDGFVCVPDASGPELGGYADPCEYTNACDPGLLCANPSAVPGCADSAGCCTHFCDLSDPEPSADCGGVADGQECISAFPEGQVPPGFEDTGICAIPE